MSRALQESSGRRGRRSKTRSIARGLNARSIWKWDCGIKITTMDWLQDLTARAENILHRLPQLVRFEIIANLFLVPLRHKRVVLGIRAHDNMIRQQSTPLLRSVLPVKSPIIHTIRFITLSSSKSSPIASPSPRLPVPGSSNRQRSGLNRIRLQFVASSRLQASRSSTSPFSTSSISSHANKAKRASDDDEHSLSPASDKATQSYSTPPGATVPGPAPPHSPSPSSSTPSPAKSSTTEIAEVNAKLAGEGVDLGEKEQSRRDWEIIKKLIPNIWPKDDWGTKTRVLVAVGLLVGGKVSLLLPLVLRWDKGGMINWQSTGVGVNYRYWTFRYPSSSKE